MQQLTSLAVRIIYLRSALPLARGVNRHDLASELAQLEATFNLLYQQETN